MTMMMTMMNIHHQKSLDIVTQDHHIVVPENAKDLTMDITEVVVIITEKLPVRINNQALGLH